MSLSQEPAFSTLKNNFVCGVRDISNEPYAGLSGRHDTSGNAVNTTNGAGPHNLQLFMLSADGTVLECLPGYWNPSDLVEEMKFANQLNSVWMNPQMSRSQKFQAFQQMQLGHIQEHPQSMVRRSRMQGFDQKYEAEHRLRTSDTIANPRMITSAMLQPGGKLPQEAFKTTDEIMHERMSVRPFLPIERFDVANYVEYGKPKYDKHEDARNSDGTVNKQMAKGAPTIGNQAVAMNGRRQNMRKRRQQQQQAMGWGNGDGWGNNTANANSNNVNYPNTNYPNNSNYQSNSNYPNYSNNSSYPNNGYNASYAGNSSGYSNSGNASYGQMSGGNSGNVVRNY